MGEQPSQPDTLPTHLKINLVPKLTALAQVFDSEAVSDQNI